MQNPHRRDCTFSFESLRDLRQIWLAREQRGKTAGIGFISRHVKISHTALWMCLACKVMYGSYLSRMTWLPRQTALVVHICCAASTQIVRDLDIWVLVCVQLDIAQTTISCGTRAIRNSLSRRRQNSHPNKNLCRSLSVSDNPCELGVLPHRPHKGYHT